jgi:hypothetical protein
MCDIDFAGESDLLKSPERLTNDLRDRQVKTLVVENEKGEMDVWVIFYDRLKNEHYRVLETGVRIKKSGAVV